MFFLDSRKSISYPQKEKEEKMDRGVDSLLELFENIKLLIQK